MAAHKRNEEETPDRRAGPGDYHLLGSLDGAGEISCETAARLGVRWTGACGRGGSRSWNCTDGAPGCGRTPSSTSCSERYPAQRHTSHELHGEELANDRHCDDKDE